MSNLADNIRSILLHYPNAYISSSGTRSIDEQIKFVKLRPTQYQKTLRKVFKDFKIDRNKIDNKNFLSTVYDGKEDWLKKTMLEFAKKGQGFQHLSGNAIDISVRELNFNRKTLLRDRLVKEGYHVILERVRGNAAQYNVDLERANVFHVDLLGSAKK